MGEPENVAAEAEAVARRSVEYQERLRNITPDDPLWPVAVEIAQRVLRIEKAQKDVDDE